MMQLRHSAGLSKLWARAAVVGSLWASVEIIAGGFLHALRAPMAGSLLAAVGVALLVGAHRLKPEPGLFWRAGLVCALMKSISPGSVVLGPMIGIFTESLLLEAATRLLGSSLIGYAVGGALAVAWCLFQKIASLIITFGPDIVTLYVRLCELAAGSLRLSALTPSGLLAALLTLDLLLGASAAVLAAGIDTRTRQAPAPAFAGPPVGERPPWKGFALDANQSFCVLLLLVNFAALLTGLLLLSAYRLWLACGYVAVFTVWVAARYRGPIRRLGRPKLWLELAALMLLSGFALGNFKHGAGAWSWEGLAAGTRMTLRAWLVSAGFAAVSVELRNPKVLAWFTCRGATGLVEALSVAFAALPVLATVVSQQRGLARQPLAALAQLLRYADSWLCEYQSGKALNARVFLLVGSSGEGKTTQAAALAARLRDQGLVVGGIVAPGLWQEGRRAGFDVVDLLDGRREALCRRDTFQGPTCGPFRFLAGGLRLGREALQLERLKQARADLVIVDEVGPLELGGEGWAQALDALIDQWPGPVLWVVRRDLADQVAARWLRVEPAIWDVRCVTVAEMAVELADHRRRR